MMHSVWNQATGAFDYYEGGGEQTALNAPKPSHIRSRALGSTVDQACWPLPAGARKVDSGPEAIGRIAKVGGGGGLAGFDSIVSSPIALCLAVGAAWFAWSHMKGKRR